MGSSVKEIERGPERNIYPVFSWRLSASWRAP